MIAAFADILSAAGRHESAVGAFTCYDATTAVGVLRAARRRSAPTILLVGEASLRAPEGALLVETLRAAARAATTPCCVQLDHTSHPELASAAITYGVGAVMADGSRLDDPANADLVRRMAALHRDVGIEAELGHIEGGEDVAQATAAGQLTDPDAAARFVGETRPACLAVSIGNVHGTYIGEPRLDWERLGRISEAVTTPLSLHGASGLTDGDLQRAVALGVCKVNVNAELRARYLAVLTEHVPRVLDGARVLELQEAVVAGVAEIVGQKIEALSPNGPWGL